MLHLLKAAVTRWLSHSAASKRCRQRCEQIIEALDDILVKNRNAEWIGYRSSLLKPTTVLQITFFDILSVINGLRLLLQGDKKDFRAISRAANSTPVILEEIKEDVDSIHLKSFKQSEDIIERVSLIEMRSAVAGGTRKQSRIDASITRIEFHSSTINSFIDALMKEITYAFDLSELSVLTAFLKLDPADLPERTSSKFREYGTRELRVLYDFHGNEATDEYHGRTTRSEKLLRCPYDALELEFGGYKSYINSQKSKVREEFLKKEHSLRSKLLLKKANKYSTKKSIRKRETEIEGAVAKVKNPVTVEDLLKDCVVSGVFPNI